MAWQDTFRLTGQVLRSPTYRPPTGGFQTPRSFGASPRPRSSGVSWSDVASGRLSNARALPAAVGDKNPIQPGMQEKGLDTFQGTLPFSSAGVRSPYAPPPATAPVSTEGDILGSIQGALGSVTQNLNLANAIPWFMERINVAAHDYADQVPGAAALASGTDAFLGAVDAASQVVGPVMEAFPKFVRDSQLADRAKLYRAIAAGETPDFGPFGFTMSNPLASIGEFGGLITNPTGAAMSKVFEGKSLNPLAPLFGRTVSDEASEAAKWQQELLTAVDPQKRLTAEARMSILRDSIDLPESVKLLIERKPSAANDELERWLDAAPEGRQWSYAEGVQGIATNMATPLLFYAAEVKGGLSALKVGRAFAGPEGLGAPGIPGITRGIGTVPSVVPRFGGKAIPSVPAITLKLQTASVAAGMGYTAVNTTMGAVARYVGDEEAVRWFDNANRTTAFSDDPMVQLVTSFSVNPFKAVNQATVGGAGKAGGWVLKHGIVAPMNVLSQRRMTKFYSSTDAMEEQIARMFKLGSKEEASRFLDEQGLRPYAHDMVMGGALDEVMARLPADERTAINAHYPDPAERAAHVLSRFHNQALDFIEKDPRAHAARFNDYDWNYRMMPGPFNAEVAAKIALDYRRAMERTYDLRAARGATIGYREYLPPQGQVLAKEAIERATTADGVVPVRAVQDLVGDFPALRKHWGGIDMGGGTITRAQADRILDSAAADWAITAKQNPVKVATGADPVLRPDSPTKMRDYAESLGTSIETVAAWTDGPGVVKDASKIELLRQYLVQHADMDPAVAGRLTPEDVYQRAFGHIDERTAPWAAMGERVVTAEKLLTDLQAELVRVRRLGGRTEHDVTVRLQRQIVELRDLVRVAGDPIRPFAAEAGARSTRAFRVKMQAAIAKLERGERAVDPRTESPPVPGVEPPTVGPDQLQALRNSLAELDPTGAGHNAHLAEMAARKVDAIDRLGRLNALDEQLQPLGLSQLDLDLVVRGADGELAWATEMSVPPEAVIAEFAGFKTANQMVFKTTVGSMGKKVRQLELSNKAHQFVNDLGEMPGSYQWAEIARSPGFVKRLREIGDDVPAGGSMTGNQMADVVEAAAIPRGVTGRPIDEIATGFGEGVTREEALQRLAEMRAARDTALDGRGPASLKRTATIKVPEDYQLQAEADMAARNLVYDAEYEAFWHPRNVAKVQEITGRADELWPGLREVVAGDPILEDGIAKVAARLGKTPDEVLADASHVAAVKAELVPPGFEAPIEGMIREFTDLDFLIRANDQDAIAALSDQFTEARSQPRPPQRVSLRAAERLARMPKQRRSYHYRTKLSNEGADFSEGPNPTLMAAPKNALGLEVLSVLNHGVGGTKPATHDGLIALLKSIEDGDAGRMGIGPEMQAEGQRVARLLLDDAVKQASRRAEDLGVFSAGVRASDITLDRLQAEHTAQQAAAEAKAAVAGKPFKPTPFRAPPFLLEDEQALAASIDHLLTFDNADPMGTLQYGLKKYPKDAVVMEWSKVPGLAEELFSKRFQTYEQRLGGAQVRQAFNYVFGSNSNQAIRLEAKNRWVERLGAKGISPKTSEAIWNRLQQEANESRSAHLHRTPEGVIVMRSGDNPMYAGIHNLPNDRINTLILGRDSKTGFLQELATGDDAISTAERAAASKTNFAEVFRESTSAIRRTLKDKVPLGDALAAAYGMAAHNKAVTTYYYWFRFGLDLRYHAMNFFEPQILAAGRAGLRSGEIDEGLLGQTESYLRNLDDDPMSNTGYQFSRSRHETAYGVFLKEQPDALRRRLATEDPELMQKAWEQIVRTDPQLQDMIVNLDGSPDPTRFLKEADAWHKKMLANVDSADDAKVIDEALAAEMRESPELAQVFDHLGQVNKDLWANVRETFYGNPNRSRAERLLNSYLLFWPFSYQIKSTKWFLKVLFDRAGGVQTNALGAVVMDRIADTHNRLLATDPEYRDWMEKHRTLVFVAQMMFPVSFDSTGVTLNPLLRGLFFERDIVRAGEIGPVYTYNKVVRPLRDEFSVDIYPAVKDIPILADIFKPSTGKPAAPAKEKP